MKSTEITSVSYSPLVELMRGGIAESIHYGAFAVVDSDGHILASHGDPGLVTFPRSSEKPLQALPFIEIGGDTHYGLSAEEKAILCASHTGSDAHVAVVTGLQLRTGIKESDLLCGIHPPADDKALLSLECELKSPTQNRNNCSGKHTGMLLHARLRNLSFDDYINPGHPLQKIILTSFAEMCSMDESKITIGIDGCSAPNFAVPLANFALAFARLFDIKHANRQRVEACQRITQAMVSHPEMVSGPNRFDTVLMELGKGKIISKGGAEGYQAISLARGLISKDSPPVGIALKVSDGDSRDYQQVMHTQFDGDEPFHLSAHDSADRARPCAVVELLRQLGALEDPSLEVLKHYGARPIFNWRKVVVGEIRPTFHIKI